MKSSLARLLPQIPQAVLANAAADVAFDGVSTDSRNVAPGNLFVALRGERFDAHDFLDQVATAGAAAVVVERVPQGCTLPALVVPDTRVALGQMAACWRRQFALPVIAVTGSNGKTTVKEMIASVLAAAFGSEHSMATRGNLNNEIGVPLTVFRLNESCKAAVIELGMNHPGEIATLTAIAQPTVGLVNNAQREHQEFMASVEAVAKENGSVIAGLAQDGVAVFPAGDTYTGIWKALAGQRKTITFGLDKEANVSGSYRASEFGSEVTITFAGNTFTVKLAAAGEHNVRNALAAAACTLAIGVAPEVVARGLETFAPVNGRLQRKTATRGAVVIDDTYNANPDSVRAAIDVLASAAAPRVLVLGDMGEVGDQGPQFHREIGAYARQRGIDCLLTLGTLTRETAAAFGPGGNHYDDIAVLNREAEALASAGTTILVKGSRFMKMERVVACLVEQQVEGNH